MLRLVITLFLTVYAQGEQEEMDPCKPNPCGDNTRCTSSNTRGNSVISCECLNGFEIPPGGDPFDGCIERRNSQTRPNPPSPNRDVDAESSPPPPPLQSPVQPLTTQRPVAAVTSSQDLSEKVEVESRLQEGKRPSFLPPRRSEEVSSVVRPVHVKNVDTPQLFPEDCLVHEDCEDSHFCSSPPDNKCTDACTLDVCGDGAVCTARLHRPVCSCPDGMEGNPYDKCTEAPSRVGMKFKRR